MNDLSFRHREFMAVGYAKPEYTRTQINRAGEVVRDVMHGNDPDDLDLAVRVVDNFRAAHQFPLNTFYMTLKNRAAKVSPKAVVSSRIKRLPSIAQKLLDRPTMNLVQMQDIGGCRAVLPTMKDVYALRDQYVETDPLVHPLAGQEYEKDYIVEPQATGYRSLHLKYRFNGREKSAPYNGLRVEMQLRTELQHQWATAVEAAGTFTSAPLKSNKGKLHWLRFFALMGSVFSIRENSPPIPGTPDSADAIAAEIRRLNDAHYIVDTFDGYRTLIPRTEQIRDARFFLIVLNPNPGGVPEALIKGFKAKQFAQANAEYADMERYYGPNSAVQVVLVRSTRVADLKRAYPSYLLDSEAFLREVRAITG